MIVNLFNASPSLQSYEPVLFHLISSAALALSVVFIINGRIVNDGSTRRSDGHTWWLVSDIAALISAGSNIVKLTADAWTILTGWRGAFMLMDNKSGLKDKDLGHVASAPPLVLLDWLGW